MRPDWDEYFIDQLPLIARRSTCLRRQIAAIITVNNRSISSGYNGAPFGFAHCRECIKNIKNIPSGQGQLECYACHAEMNAIASCAAEGNSCKRGTIYISVSPCSYCAKLIIQSGIKRIVFNELYPDDFTFDLLKKANIEVVHFHKEVR